MKKLITVLAVSVMALVQQGLSADNMCCPSATDCFSCTTVDFNVGFRTDDIDFRIGSEAGDQTFSKALFDDLRSYTFGATLKTLIGGCGYLRGYADYGHIYSGKNHTRQFIQECPFTDSERVKFDTRRGEVWDISAGIGYQFCACDDRLTFAPLFGYSVHEQRVRRFGPLHTFFEESFLPENDSCSDKCSNSHHGHRSVAKGASCSFPSPISSSQGSCSRDLKCFTSSFRSRWTGPWVGVDVSYQCSCNLSLYGSFEYHWVRFRGKGRFDFKNVYIEDFRLSANGDGQIYTLGGTYTCNECWAFGLEGRWHQFETRHGSDRVFQTIFDDESKHHHHKSHGSSTSSSSSSSSSSNDFAAGKKDIRNGAVGCQFSREYRLRDAEWEAASIVATATFKF